MMDGAIREIAVFPALTTVWCAWIRWFRRFERRKNRFCTDPAEFRWPVFWRIERWC